MSGTRLEHKQTLDRIARWEPVRVSAFCPPCFRFFPVFGFLGGRDELRGYNFRTWPESDRTWASGCSIRGMSIRTNVMTAGVVSAAISGEFCIWFEFFSEVISPFSQNTGLKSIPVLLPTRERLLPLTPAKLSLVI